MTGELGWFHLRGCHTGERLYPNDAPVGNAVPLVATFGGVSTQTTATLAVD